ncbi:hypothetical protein [Oenococcus oeni]|uniref:hypothetical protein n=1 Tax=Oenococcus oeni TaxID=1247 RepID=UPI0039C9122C
MFARFSETQFKNGVVTDAAARSTKEPTSVAQKGTMNISNAAARPTKEPTSVAQKGTMNISKGVFPVSHIPTKAAANPAITAETG